jgi:hypothetical protein
MPNLKNCYDELSQIAGSDMEPYSSVQLVEEYRQYWKPDNVKVILLAESHVFTTEEDQQIKFEVPLDGYPESFSNFVYCLGLGEKELTKHPSSGTPQFWKMFYSCVNKVDSLDDFSAVLSKTPFPQRLQNKISLLETMKKRGIWLVDASIIALYRSGGERYENKTYKELVHCSWQNYTSQIITESDPSYVICIGKSVGDVVGDGLKELMQDNYSVFPAPNAHLSSDEHMALFGDYYRICEKFRHKMPVDWDDLIKFIERIGNMEEPYIIENTNGSSGKLRFHGGGGSIVTEEKIFKYDNDTDLSELQRDGWLIE